MKRYDVRMRAYGIAETWQLIGTFLLEPLSKNCYKDIIGSHHNNRLSVCKIKSNRQPERIKKNLKKYILELRFTYDS